MAKRRTMNLGKYGNVYFRGRVAYGISCFESALITLKYDLNEWKAL